MVQLIKPKLTDFGKNENKAEVKSQIPTDSEGIKKYLEIIPNPVGYRMLVRPWSGQAKTKGGVILADETQDKIQMTTVVGLVICFLILKFMFRKDPKPIDLLIISFFSSVPGLLVFPVLFIQDPLVQALLVFITSIYALIAFGSGIKQVYLLRNIEVVLVVIALTFGGSILGSV